MTRRSARVCVVRHGYFPDDPRVRREVGALLDAGHEVDVVCLRAEGEERTGTWRSARIHRLPVRHERRGVARYLFEYSSFFLLAFAKVTSLHLRRRYRLVQVHTLPDALVFVALVPKLFGAKVLLDMHELMPEFAAVKFGSRGSRLVRAITRAERWSARFADVVVGVSPLQASILERRIGKTCHVVPNVPDEELLSHAPTAPPAEPVPLLVTHGTLTEGYGVQTLIEALPLVREEVEARALIVGDGEYLGELRRQADLLGVRDAVEFTGRVPFTDVAGHLARARVGVVTLLRDGYMELLVPNKLFEYVALGLPVVAADLPGIRSYFGDDEVVYFEPGDPRDLAEKVVALLTDEQLRADVVARSRRVYDEVGWERSAEVYLRLVDGLVGTGAT